MSLSTQVASLYLAQVQSDNVRQNTLSPAAGVAPAAVTAGKQAYGAWAQLAAAAAITDPSWLAYVLAFPTTVDTEFTWDVQVGVGAACAESARANVNFAQKAVSAVGVVGSIAQVLVTPIRITGAPRVAARGATNDCASTQVIGVKAGFITALGT